MHRGYVLTCESQDVNGKHRITLTGTGPEGPFTIIVTDNNPVFFIPSKQTPDGIEFLGRRPLKLTSFDGEAVDALYFESLHQYYQAREILRAKGFRVFESDIFPSDRYLMERFINSGIEWTGPVRQTPQGPVYFDPQLQAVREEPAFRVLSIDIETGQNGQVYSIAMHGTGYNCIIEEFSKVLLHSDHNGGNGEIQYCRGEQGTLQAFALWIKKWDPDLITGWHVIGFDLKFLRERFLHYGIPFNLGRQDQPLKIKENRGGFFAAETRGRQIVDSLQLMKQNFFKFENFKLETVAQEVLGRGKDISSEEDKVTEIERRYREDPASLARYNLEDCRLVSDIIKKTSLLDLICARRELTGLPLDQVNRTIAAFDHFYLPRIHRKGYVAPDVADISEGESASGGYVFSQEPGRYDHVAVLDFKSLYPTVILTFHIDPLALLERRENTITTPSGHSFSRTESILPEFLTRLMEKRKEAKEQNNPQLSQAVKILMNSFYGAMGTTGCRFYHPHLPKAITETGQWVLKQTVNWLKKEGYKVIYGDTDSVFVCLKEQEIRSSDESGRRLTEKINHFMEMKITEESGVFSHLEIEYEKHYSSFFLPPLRGTETGARKRYAGMLRKGGVDTLEFTGMEYVRSDWTELARNFQYELFRHFFHKEDAAEWIKKFVEDLKEGRMDEELVYRKGLSKSPEKYTTHIPPHVKAAMLLTPEKRNNIREIRYIITMDGPMPLPAEGAIPDYEHYIEKQLRPLAEAVLPYMGLRFDEIFYGKQLDLF